MQITFASYNIRKAVGRDGARDPARILDVVDELGADIVALQEVDIRFGAREGVIERIALSHRGWQVASVPMRPQSLGWHGNALLVREGIGIEEVAGDHLPRLEPRGAVRALLHVGGQDICVTGVHLDLSGFMRQRQLAHICGASRAPDVPAVMLGDFNTWRTVFPRGRGLAAHWSMVEPGVSFPSHRPFLSLDRLVHTPHWQVDSAQVHSSPLAREASDHLPIRVELSLLNN